MSDQKPDYSPPLQSYQMNLPCFLAIAASGRTTCRGVILHALACIIRADRCRWFVTAIEAVQNYTHNLKPEANIWFYKSTNFTMIHWASYMLCSHYTKISIIITAIQKRVKLQFYQQNENFFRSCLSRAEIISCFLLRCHKRSSTRIIYIILLYLLIQVSHIQSLWVFLICRLQTGLQTSGCLWFDYWSQNQQGKGQIKSYRSLSCSSDSWKLRKVNILYCDQYLWRKQ